MSDLTYSVLPAVVDLETDLKAAAVVRRFVPDTAGRLELLAMLGLTQLSRRGPAEPGGGGE